MVLRVTTSDVRKKAFFSGTDNNDDRGNCYISGVVGKLTTTKEMVFRFNLPGNMKIDPLDMNSIFEGEASPEVPAEWLAQVKRQVYTPPAFNTYQYGQNRGGNLNTGGAANNVVANPNFRQNSRALAGQALGLSEDDQEVLNQFGYPFPEGEEGQGPFPQRPLTKGRHSRKGSGSKKTSKNSGKIPRIPRNPHNVIS